MIWLGEIVAGEAVPVRAQFHDDTGAAADPTAPFARMETGSGTFADLTAPTKRDSKTGYFGVDIDTTGFAAGIRTVRIGGTVATNKAVAAVYGFRVVAHRAESAAKPSDLPSVATLESRLTAARAGYLDKLNVSGTIALAGEAAAAVAPLGTPLQADDYTPPPTDYARPEDVQLTVNPTVLDPTERSSIAAAVDTTLSTSHGAGSWGAADGPGDIDCTYRVLLDSDGDGVPDDPPVGIPGAACMLTSDEAGAVRVGSMKVADSLGNVTWRGLVAGTYYVWREHPLYSFRDPVTVIVEDGS